MRRVLAVGVAIIVATWAGTVFALAGTHPHPMQAVQVSPVRAVYPAPFQFPIGGMLCYDQNATTQVCWPISREEREL